MKSGLKLVRAQIALLLFITLFSNPGFSAKETAGDWLAYKGGAQRLGVSNEAEVGTPLKVVWKYTPEGKTNGFVDWGPVVAEGIVYTSDGLNNILALNEASGEIVWQKKVVSNAFSVTLSEDAKILYVTTAITTKPTPTLYAFDPKTGEELWNNMSFSQEAVGGMEGAPAVQDGKIYVGYLQYEGHGGVMAFDGKTGKKLWHWSVKKFSPYSPVSYGDGKVFVGFENKALVCLEAATGKVLWSQADLPDLPYGAPTIVGKTVYFSAGSMVYALDTRTGAIQWQKTIEGQIGHSSVSFYEKTLYVGTRESKVFALQAANGEVIWTADLQKGIIESSLTIDLKKKVLYLGTQDNFFLTLDMKNGKIKNELKLSDDPRGVWKSAPALYHKRIYIGSLDRSFYALE